MGIYTSLFIRRCFNACVSLYSFVSLIILNGFDRVTWLVLLFELVRCTGRCNGNCFGLSVRVRISTVADENKAPYDGGGVAEEDPLAAHEVIAKDTEDTIWCVG